jgi:hypothetical protein
LFDIGKVGLFPYTNISLPNVEKRMHAVQNIRIFAISPTPSMMMKNKKDEASHLLVS